MANEPDNAMQESVQTLAAHHEETYDNEYEEIDIHNLEIEIKKIKEIRIHKNFLARHFLN